MNKRFFAQGGVTPYPDEEASGPAAPASSSRAKLNPMKTRTFNLRLWFAVGSFGTIAAICLISAYWVSNFLVSTLLERESEVSKEFMESIVSVDGAQMFRDDGTQPYRPSEQLLDFAHHIVSMPGVLRVNIHSAKHRVLWSTEQELIGKVFDDNDELNTALRGQRITEIGTLDGDTKAEHVALGKSGHFIEAYIPIRDDGGHGPVVGVVEFYKLPLALQAAIDSARRTVWISATAAAIVLFLTLYWIVQRGARLIERQQQHLAHMEAFAAIGQMSSAVAHSLRNPMSAIRSSAELWRSELKGEECEIAAEVIREVDRMDRYVRDLLAYARSETYHLQAVHPLKVIETILAKQQGAIERNRIAVQLVDHCAAEVTVTADEMLLEQALTSIVTNAIEAMPAGGELSVSVLPAGRKFVRIEIVDTGRGIPAELLARVTDSYFTTKSRGLGLGLMLSKAIIERFEGNVEIASTPDVGTSVLIDLKSA